MSAAGGVPRVPKLTGAGMLPPVGGAISARPTRRAAAGRFAEINGFVDYTMHALTPAARSVWLILWRDTKADGMAKTGQADLARRAGVTDRAVRTALSELEGAGLLTVVRRGGVKAGASVYRVRGVNPGEGGNRKSTSGHDRKPASAGCGSGLPASQNGTRSGGPPARPPPDTRRPAGRRR